MHKAKLFLLAVFSLIMLIPFGSGMNTISDAMAIETNSELIQDDNTQQMFANNQAEEANSMIDSNVSPSSLSGSQEITPQQTKSNPPGLSKIIISPENLYIALGPGDEGSNIASDIASCDPGDIAISGGIQAANFETAIAQISDVPQTLFDPFDNFNSWAGIVVGEDDVIDRLSVQAYAQCFDNAPAHTP